MLAHIQIKMVSFNNISLIFIYQLFYSLQKKYAVCIYCKNMILLQDNIHVRYGKQILMCVLYTVLK